MEKRLGTVRRNPVLGVGAVAGLVERRSTRLSCLLRASGRMGNPRAMAATAVTRTVISALVVAPAAVVAAVLVTPWCLCACAIPLVFFWGSELGLRDAAQQRKEGGERELPYFSVIASVLAGAGLPLHSILKGLAAAEGFPFLRKEAMLVERDVAIFGMHPTDALERLASAHPSKKLAGFLLGYTSKARSGGDTPGFLTGESGSLLRELEDGWENYATRVGVVGSLMITVFGVVPLLLMVVGIFSPQTSTVGLLLFAGLCVPLVTAGLVLMSGRMQPVHDEALHGAMARGLLCAALGGAVGAALGVVWVAVALALFSFFAAYGFDVRAQLKRAKSFDDGLFRFMKDLLDYVRQEYDLARAVVSIDASCHYPREFSAALSKLSTQLRGGVPLDQARVDAPTRLGKLVFLMLGEMGRSGGGTVDTVYQVSRFASMMGAMKEKVAAEVKPYLLLSYIAPGLLAFGVTFVESVLSTVGRSYGAGLAALHLDATQGASVPPGMSQVSDLLIVVSAAALGLIGAKVADLTVKNTIRAALNVAIATGAVAAMTFLGPHFLPQLFPASQAVGR